MRPSNTLESKTPSDTYLRVQPVCMKVQAHSSLEPPVAYNQDQSDTFDESRFNMTLLTILGVTEMLCSFIKLLLRFRKR